MIGGTGLTRVKHWLLAGWFASVTIALSEAICTALLSPFAWGSPGVLLSALGASVGVLLIWALLLALAFALLPAHAKAFALRRIPTARSLAGGLLVALFVAGCAHALYQLVDPIHYEFLGPV